MPDDPRSGPIDAALAGWRCLEARGPWPFITRREFDRSDRARHVWISRAHRKRLAGEVLLVEGRMLVRCLWAPRTLNWWIATLFAFGAALFMLGSVLSLAPALARHIGLSSTQVNAVFFAGSIPFTTAAYLQLFQSANAPEGPTPEARPPASRRYFGWRPRDIGWLSCALQFPGTVLFNFNTFDAMIPGLTWFRQELLVWVPNIVGSLLFLVSGYLAFIEVCHAHWAWKPRSLSWWVTFTNLLGCVGFMIAALCAFVPSGLPHETWVTLSLVFTLLGASGFLAGSCLMLPESGQS
jgi:hypothetical protein